MRKAAFLRITCLIILILSQVTFCESYNQEESYNKYIYGLLYSYDTEYEKALESLKKLRSEIPDEIHSMDKDIFNNLIKTGKNKEALELGEKLFDKYKDNYSFLLEMARLYSSINNLDEALSCARLAKNISENEVSANFYLGFVLNQKGNLLEALENLDEFLEVYPNSLEALGLKANIFERQKKIDEAIEIYKKLISYYPDMTQVRFSLARLLKKKDPGKAEKVYIDLLDYVHDPFKRAVIYNRLGALRLMLKDFIVGEHYFLKALKILEEECKKTNKQYRENQIIYTLSMLYLIALKQKDLELQIKYQKNLVLFKNNVKEYIKLSTLYDKANLTKKSIKTLKKAIKVLNKNTPELYFYIGLKYFVLKKYSKCKKYLLKTLKYLESHEQALYYLSSLYNKEGALDKAFKTYKKLLKLNPNDGNAANFVGYTLADQGIELDKAERLIKVALNNNNNNQVYLDSMGWLYYRKGDLKKSIEYLKKASTLEDPLIYEHLGEVLFEMGKFKDAYVAYDASYYLNNKNEKHKNKFIKYSKDIVSWDKEVINKRLEIIKNILSKNIVTGSAIIEGVYKKNKIKLKCKFNYKYPYSLKLDIFDGTIIVLENDIYYKKFGTDSLVSIKRNFPFTFNKFKNLSNMNLDKNILHSNVNDVKSYDINNGKIKFSQDNYLESIELFKEGSFDKDYKVNFLKWTYLKKYYLPYPKVIYINIIEDDLSIKIKIDKIDDVYFDKEE